MYKTNINPLLTYTEKIKLQTSLFSVHFS